MASTMLFVVLGALAMASHMVAADSERHNVLMLIADDLRPNLGAYGHPFMHTPNIDKLAASGLLFNRAYVQYSFCAPSRNSFMTGRRPDRTRDWNFIDHFREPSVGANWTSMPEYFKKHDYLTLGAGKLFHVGLPPAFDVPKSWSPDMPYVSPAQCDPASLNMSGVSCPAGTTNCYEPAMVAGDGKHYCAIDESKLEYPLYDRVTVNATISHLRYAKKTGKNFFIGCGFHRPHLPWAAPKEFYDLYTDTLPPPKHPDVPVGMPEVAWHQGNFNNTRTTSCPAEDASRFRHGYYAAISYMDSLVGQVLQELDDLGLADNTIVALWGDHGWQLGEHNLWRKMTNYELGVRIPLIVRSPFKKNSIGKKTSALVEIVDMYQTFAELAGLPPPEENLEGTSLAPIFDNPPTSGTGIKQYAFSQFAKGITHGEPWDTCTRCTRNTIDFMGFTIRSDKWRYTEWVPWNKEKVKPMWENVNATELYSHENDAGDDFDCCENENVVHVKENSKIVAELQAELRAQFQHDT